eukprot:gene13818-46864_t
MDDFPRPDHGEQAGVQGWAPVWDAAGDPAVFPPPRPPPGNPLSPAHPFVALQRQRSERAQLGVGLGVGERAAAVPPPLALTAVDAGGRDAVGLCDGLGGDLWAGLPEANEL